MTEFYCELDASIEFGSGYICVVGPPSSGKSNLVLSYLVGREERFAAMRVGGTAAGAKEDAAVSAASPPVPTFLMEYWSARSFGGDALSQMSHRVQLATAATTAAGGARRRPRLTYECTPLEFGARVAQWLEAQGPGSELHLVVDDADSLDADNETINTWLSNCLNGAAAANSKVCLWLVSQLPLRVPNCFRFHFVSPLSADAVCEWVLAEHRAHGRLLALEEEAAHELARPASGDAVGEDGPLREYTLSAQAASECVAKAVRYYATHQPMCASVVSKDIRLLIQRVYQLLPALVLMGGEAAGGALRLNINAIHYSSAWGRFKDLRTQTDGATETSLAAASADPLVRALRKIGLSAVLLAFSAFFCGAVPKQKQLEVFGVGAAERRATARTETNAQSHRASVLSAAAHVIALPRLLLIYEAMLKMCVEHIDPLEFASTDVAVHYIHGFQAWGLLTPVISQRSWKRYHCWIPVSTAVHLGKVLSLSLFNLIPS